MVVAFRTYRHAPATYLSSHRTNLNDRRQQPGFVSSRQKCPGTEVLHQAFVVNPLHFSQQWKTQTQELCVIFEVWWCLLWSHRNYTVHLSLKLSEPPPSPSAHTLTHTLLLPSLDHLSLSHKLYAQL